MLRQNSTGGCASRRNELVRRQFCDTDDTNGRRHLVGLPVNFHVNRRCNAACRFCFATFEEGPDHLPLQDALRVVGCLRRAGAEKITFAGGEPTLLPYLGELLDYAKSRDLAQFLEWGRLARWLRGAVVDFDTWARVAGRLRWLASRIQKKAPQLAQTLDPSFRPPATWAASLGRDPVEQKRKKERAALYRRLPGLSAGDESGVLAWLREALELLDRDALAKAVAPLRDIVVALRIEDFKDRRHRRRLRGVQDILRGGPADPTLANGDEDVADHEKPRKPEQPGRSLSVGTTGMPSGSVRG